MNKYEVIDDINTKLIIRYKGEWVTTYISTEDLDKVKQGKWNIMKKPNGTLYVQGRLPGSNNRVLLHRYLMPDAEVVDHWDRWTLNNARINLRSVDTTTNVRNRTVTNPTGVHGVFKTPSDKYRVRIKVQGKNLNIGTFDTMDEAIQARKQAEGLHW